MKAEDHQHGKKRLDPWVAKTQGGGTLALDVSRLLLPAEQRGTQYQVTVEILQEYRGAFNTLVLGEIKPYSGSLKEGNCKPAMKTSDTAH